MSNQQLFVKWNNHQTNMSTIFNELLENDNFVDVTLAGDGDSIKAHKMVLSACSPFFRNLLVNNPCPHPIIILSNVSFKHVKTLVEFMYKGQVQIARASLQEVFQTAEILKIKGLGEVGKTSKASTKSAPVSTNHKKGDHHYSCSTIKSKKKKSSSSPSESKPVENTESEEIFAEIVNNGSPDIVIPVEVPNDPIVTDSANMLTAIELDQTQLESVNVDMNALKAADNGTHPEENESCVLMPLVDADENTISELSVSDLEGKQLAQVTDESGNTVLVLIPDGGPADLAVAAAAAANEEFIDTTEQTEPSPKKSKRKRQKLEEPDYTELHFKKSDGTTIKLYQCLQCDSKFANPGNVRRHTFSAHKGFRIKCEMCNTQFTQKSSKDSHFRTVHAGVRFNCDKCDCHFTEKRSLLHHVASVHGITTDE